MDVMEQLQRLRCQPAAARRRASSRALAAIGVAVFALTGFGGYYLSRPSMEMLYAGLDRQDVSSIGAALHEADIAFDVSSDGTAVMVRYGQTAQARMLLAEKGLPHSTNAGYELYDKMGSLGLTSFMQDVTRRARARRRAGAHHPDHGGHPRRARPYRAAGRRLVPPHQAAAPRPRS